MTQRLSPVKAGAKTLSVIDISWRQGHDIGGPMKFTIKIQHRSVGAKPWKWEIFYYGRLLTASHEFFGSQFEAHAFARAALVRLKQTIPKPTLPPEPSPRFKSLL